MQRAPINAATLAWARQVSGLGIDDLASATGVKPERVRQFEGGDASPTFKQLVKMAKKLDRTPAFFFMPPPDSADVPNTVDFRQSPDFDGLDASTTKALRRAERYRKIMVEYGDTAHTPIELAKPFRRGQEHRAADEMRHILGLDADFTPDGSAEAGFRFWRQLLESHGVLVFQTSEVDRGTFRGLSVYHDILPIIVLNGKDSSPGKSFTLFHEVAHLINRSSGLCMLEEHDSEEALANSFAAHFLMPEETVLKQLAAESNDAVGETASTFKVSRVAAAIRLKNLGGVNEQEVAKEKVASDAAWKRSRDKLRDSNAGPPHWRIRYRDLGPTYIGTVARALQDERISELDAAYFLDARVPVVDQLILHYNQSESA